MERTKEDYINALMECYRMTREQAEERYEKAIEDNDTSFLNFVCDLKTMMNTVFGYFGMEVK